MEVPQVGPWVRGLSATTMVSPLPLPADVSRPPPLHLAHPFPFSSLITAPVSTLHFLLVNPPPLPTPSMDGAKAGCRQCDLRGAGKTTPPLPAPALSLLGYSQNGSGRHLPRTYEKAAGFNYVQNPADSPESPFWEEIPPGTGWGGGRKWQDGPWCAKCSFPKEQPGWMDVVQGELGAPRISPPTPPKSLACSSGADRTVWESPGCPHGFSSSTRTTLGAADQLNLWRGWEERCRRRVGASRWLRECCRTQTLLWCHCQVTTTSDEGYLGMLQQLWGGHSKLVGRGLVSTNRNK